MHLQEANILNFSSPNLSKQSVFTHDGSSVAIQFFHWGCEDLGGIGAVCEKLTNNLDLAYVFSYQPTFQPFQRISILGIRFPSLLPACIRTLHKPNLIFLSTSLADCPYTHILQRKITVDLP